METPELANANAFMSMHLEDKVLSHAPAIGLHWDIIAKIKARPLAITNPMMAMIIIRNTGRRNIRR